MTSTAGGPISAPEIMDRGKFWLQSDPPYDSGASAPDPQGRRYRTDCSGYVSMAWHLDVQHSTVDLPDIAVQLGAGDLRPGDVLMVGGEGTEDGNGHVVIFGGWANQRHTEYHAYELCGSSGMTYTSNMPYPYWSANPGVYLPYRYGNVVPDDPSHAADGTLVRDAADGAIYVLAGGARYHFASLPEIEECGYRPNFADYPHDVISMLPTMARNGTLLRDAVTGLTALVVGGAAVAFRDVNEIAHCGYAQPGVNVPVRYIRGMPAVPQDNTLLRDPADGTVSVVAGGAAVPFASPQELFGAGFGWTQWNVPAPYLRTLPATPRDRTLLRDPSTAKVFVVAGGAKLRIGTPAELVAAGYGWTQVNVPPAYLSGLPDTPRDGTLLRDPATGQVWQMVGPHRKAVDAGAAAIGEAPPPVPVPSAVLNAFPIS